MRMTRPVAFAAGFLGVLVSGAAIAGPASPNFDWAGPYIGAHVGHATGNAAASDPIVYSDTTGTTPVGSFPGFSFPTKGIGGGAEAGYNWQFGSVVLGLQGDVAATRVNGSFNDTVNQFALESTLTWLSTFRGQVGIAHDRFLFFGTAGLAVGHVRGDLHDFYAAGTVDTSSENTSVGYVIGGGVAAALDAHWSIKAEYLHVDLGTSTFRFYEPPPRIPLLTSEGSHTFEVLRFALDYRF